PPPLSSLSPVPRTLPSFPTRRSSDLSAPRGKKFSSKLLEKITSPIKVELLKLAVVCIALSAFGCATTANATSSQLAIVLSATPRSEEHTSELQSRFDLVCRLLLEKKT